MVWSSYCPNKQDPTQTHKHQKERKNTQRHTIVSIWFTSFEVNSNRIYKLCIESFIWEKCDWVFISQCVNAFVVNWFCIGMKCQYDQKRIDFQSNILLLGTQQKELEDKNQNYKRKKVYVSQKDTEYTTRKKDAFEPENMPIKIFIVFLWWFFIDMSTSTFWMVLLKIWIQLVDNEPMLFFLYPCVCVCEIQEYKTRRNLESLFW